MKTPICKDCIHLIWVGAPTIHFMATVPRCVAKTPAQISLTSGRTYYIKPPHPQDERTAKGKDHCGPEGKFFSPKGFKRLWGKIKQALLPTIFKDTPHAIQP